MDEREILERVKKATRKIWAFLKDDDDPELLTDAAEILEDLWDDLDEAVHREDE